MAIKVLVCGACGKMGKEVLKAVISCPDMELAGAVDVTQTGRKVAELLGSGPDLRIEKDLPFVLKAVKPDVLIDFTNPLVGFNNVSTAMLHGANCVVGTTGFSSGQLEHLSSAALEKGLGVLVAPNFAVGAVLMMKFAAQAAKYFNQAEIIELHHDQKMDAPSGTAIKTAEMIIAERKELAPEKRDFIEKVKGVRGGDMQGIRMHSVRLPGLIAHQEVLFGDNGQTLTIRHDSLSRESFMPGVILAVKYVCENKGFVYGLDKILAW
ncbi:MAG: 4-hydroxy-tetrahydrodipicolinate reductase [Bacillota bacterium]